MVVLEQIHRHFVDFFGVAGDFLVEYARPHEGIELEFGRLRREPIDKEMVVEVLTDGEQIVIEFLNFLVLAQNLHCFHLAFDHRVEPFNQLILQLVGKLIRGEITQALVDQPKVHVSD